MFYARIAIAQCTEESDQRDGATCPVFKAKLLLFSNSSAPPSGQDFPDDLSISPIEDQIVPIVNTTGAKIGVNDEIIVGQTVDERWVIIDSPGPARIQFVTTNTMGSQQVSVKVLRVHGAAPDLSGGGFLKFGDTLTVTDPFNLWAEVEMNATGWAYYVAASTDDTETSEITEPTHPARYEIEECSLPIKEIEGVINDCLKQEDADALVTINLPGGDTRSSYPCVDTPPEMSEGGGGITAKNSYNLDAVAGSKVWIKRVTNLKPSTPEDYTLGGGSATQADWHIIRVEKPIARWIQVKAYGGNWEYISGGGGFYDGFSAYDDCPAPISGNSTDCWPRDGVEGYAFYNSNDHEYIAVATDSALLGPPGKIPYIPGSDSPRNQAINFSSCPTLKMTYTNSEFLGWAEDQTRPDCIDAFGVDALLGLASTPVLTGVSVCAGACTFTSTLQGGVWQWVGSGCENLCSCSYGSSSLPDASTMPGQTLSGTCGNASGQEGICFGTGTALTCSPATSTGTYCIPTTDCEDEDDGSGSP